MTTATTISVPGPPLLRVRSMTTEFATAEGVVRAVRSVDLDVRAGERVGIVGESGSGKSALALSILGLIDPPGRIVSGSVFLEERGTGADGRARAAEGQG